MNHNPHTAPLDTAPPAPRPADTRPLYKRKRVWIGGIAIFALGVMGGTENGRDAAVAVAKAQLKPTATATATETVTATPKPTITVTKTAKPKPAPTVTVTETADDSSWDTAEDSSWDTGDDNSSGGGSTYYSNCSAARAAGDTPLYSGDPGYDSHLDRDGDGVACE
jgi:hypothetical protein